MIKLRRHYSCFVSNLSLRFKFDPYPRLVTDKVAGIMCFERICNDLISLLYSMGDFHN